MLKESAHAGRNSRHHKAGSRNFSKEDASHRPEEGHDPFGHLQCDSRSAGCFTVQHCWMYCGNRLHQLPSELSSSPGRAWLPLLPRHFHGCAIDHLLLFSGSSWALTLRHRGMGYFCTPQLAFPANGMHHMQNKLQIAHHCAMQGV